MKKTAILGMLLLMSFTLVSAYNFVGEEVSPTCLGTLEVSDLDFSDGYGEYVYCTYSMEVNGVQDEFGMFPLSLGNQDGTNEFGQTLYCGMCDGDGNSIPYSLEEGENEWNVVLSKVTTSYDENTHSWVIGEASILDKKGEGWTTITEPDETFIRSLIESLLGVVCQVHNFGFCTI